MGLLDKITGADKANKAAKRARKSQEAMYKQGREDLAPYRDFGKGFLTDLGGFVRGPRNMPTRPTPESLTSLPGYQFRLNEGTRALDNSAISKGGLLSGNHLRDILSYGQDYASNEYDKELARYNNDVQLNEGLHQNAFNRLLGTVNLGYGAAGGSAGLGQNTANALSNIYMQQGQQQMEAAQFPWKLAAKGAGAYFGGGMG